MYPTNLFRDDGTPAYTFFVKRRAYAPPCIAIDIPGTPSGRYQKRVSIVLKDVEQTWLRVADLWMKGCGLSTKTTTGRLAYESFMVGLDPFLLRYEVPTMVKRVFLNP